jgi:hypothetical protein
LWRSITLQSDLGNELGNVLQQLPPETAFAEDELAIAVVERFRVEGYDEDVVIRECFDA